MTLAADVDLLLRDFSVPRDRYSHGSRTVRSPLTGEIIANVQDTSPDSVTEAIAQAKTAFLEWRSIPAPRRGELVRTLGGEMRGAKAALGPYGQEIETARKMGSYPHPGVAAPRVARYVFGEINGAHRGSAGKRGNLWSDRSGPG
jgi:hypothetical protein